MLRQKLKKPHTVQQYKQYKNTDKQKWILNFIEFILQFQILECQENDDIRIPGGMNMLLFGRIKI